MSNPAPTDRASIRVLGDQFVLSIQRHSGEIQHFLSMAAEGRQGTHIMGALVKLQSVCMAPPAHRPFHAACYLELQPHGLSLGDRGDLLPCVVINRGSGILSKDSESVLREIVVHGLCAGDGWCASSSDSE